MRHGAAALDRVGLRGGGELQLARLVRVVVRLRLAVLLLPLLRLAVLRLLVCRLLLPLLLLRLLLPLLLLAARSVRSISHRPRHHDFRNYS